MPEIKYHNITLKISSQKKICTGYYLLRMKHGAPAEKDIVPGRFVSIKCGDGSFLMRPFSISGASPGSIELTYKALGPATRWLAGRKKGECLEALLPLGNGFPLPEKGRLHGNVFLVAGGSGAASLAFLASFLKKYHGGGSRILFHGGKTRNDLICRKVFKDAGFSVKVSTEDGSAGARGLITVLFQKHLSRLSPEEASSSTAYSCGPRGMLEKTSVLCAAYGIKCFVSLEEAMACGIGACRGCVVKVRDAAEKEGFAYKSVCKDGPVFDSREIIW